MSSNFIASTIYGAMHPGIHIDHFTVDKDNVTFEMFRPSTHEDLALKDLIGNVFSRDANIMVELTHEHLSNDFQSLDDPNPVQGSLDPSWYIKIIR